MAGTISLIAAPATLIAGAAALAATAISGAATGAACARAGAKVSYRTIVSEVWTEKTAKFKYEAPHGHRI